MTVEARLDGTGEGAQEHRVQEREGPVYVTEVWCPPVDDGVVRMHSRMKEPEPELEAGS